MNNTLASNGYRPDIDGLRAVAVCSVLGFHAGIPGISGGFAGVDVFFVISGFLITSLLVDEYNRTRRVSLTAFWARRIRRLAPALILVLAVILLSSVLFLERVSGEVGALARAALWVSLINANHFFLLQDGDYFSAAAESNPLLHTWSLAVEEQYYLVWPVAIALGMKVFSMRTILYLAFTVLVPSLLASWYWTATDPAVAFYIAPSRAWELMVGSCLALSQKGGWLPQSPKLLKFLASIGFLAICFSMALLSSDRYFPSPTGLFPVLGTAMVIAARCRSNNNTVVSNLLSWGPLVYIGKISYPLYLWHWPILVTMRSNRLYEESILMDLVALAIAIAIAIVTYEFVEQRIWRVAKRKNKRWIFVCGISATVAVMFMALIVGAWARFGWWYSEEERWLDASRKDMPQLNCLFSERLPTSKEIDDCFPDMDKPAVLLWGDSHANHWRSAIESAGEKVGVTVATLTQRACRPLSGPVGSDACVEFNRFVASNLAQWKQDRKLQGIILSARWPEGTGTIATSVSDRTSWKPGHYFDKRANSQQELLALFAVELRSVLATARDYGLKVLLVMPSPVQKYAAAHCLSVLESHRCLVTEDALSAYVSPAEKILREVATEFDNVRLLEPRSFMCQGGNCPVVIDGVIAYTDDDHISNSFAIKIADAFVPLLNWVRIGFVDLAFSYSPPSLINPRTPLSAAHK